MSFNRFFYIAQDVCKNKIYGKEFLSVPLNNLNVYWLIDNIDQVFNQKQYEQILLGTFFFKLTYKGKKILRAKFKKNSYYNHIVSEK